MPDRATLRPSDAQPPLPLDRLIRAERPADDAVHFDVLFVGAGPAALAGAIALAQLARQSPPDGALHHLEIGVLEKAGALGEHSLSGAVVNPVGFHALFPELEATDFPFHGPVTRERVYLMSRRHRLRVPAPPTMHNPGNYTASLCQMVRWLGERAETLGVSVLTGFAAGCLLVEGDAVRGVRTTPAGLDRSGQPGPAYLPPTDVRARVTVLAEGSRGALTQAWLAWQKVGAPNPQIHALGVKELWRTERPPEAVVHTLGWPLPRDAFGGSFLYPMGPGRMAIGLVVGLDYADHDLSPHDLLQDLEAHPRMRPYFEGGELLEWGAKTIPEGGFHSIPHRVHGDGVLLIGDSAGLVDVASLKGIHYAMHSGMLAARAAFEGLRTRDVSARGLRRYETDLRQSFIARDLERTRNVRLAFKRGFLLGSASAALMTLSGGRLLGRRIDIESDACTPRRVTPSSRRHPPADRARLRKEDAVFHSGNDTRDDIPSHLVLPAEVSPELATFYASLCPAGVYEREDGKLIVHPPNCIDCKATDVLGPRWLPREGGTGPRYRDM